MSLYHADSKVPVSRLTGNLVPVLDFTDCRSLIMSVMYVVNFRACFRLAAYVFIFVAALQSKAVAQNNGTGASAGAGAGDKPVSHPVCIHCPPPEFPPEARRAKIESGDVSLGITVSEKGRVSDIHVLSDPGHGFAKEAVAAVKHWKFKPAVTKDGRKVSMYLPVLVSSRLMAK